MAHQTSNRRTLAAPDLQIPLDPSSRKPKPNPCSAAVPIIHPLPDPPSSTIQSISHRFSKLYINHKKTKPHPHPQPDPNFSHTSCTALTKSSSQHGRRSSGGGGIIPVVAEKFVDKNQLVKKGDSKKDPPKESSFDVKKGFEEGGEMRGGRNSVSSIPPTVKGGVRRRSFCTSQLELADFFSCSAVKVVAVDMPPFMQIHAVNCARKAHDSLEKFTSKTLAFTLKKEFDGVYGPAWHCIVGTSFGSFVTHSVGGFMYFSMDHKLYILLFKTAVQRAE